MTVELVYVPREQWGSSRETESYIAGRRVYLPADKQSVHVHHTAAIDVDDNTPNRWDKAEAIAYMKRLETVRPDLGPLPYSMNLAASEDLRTVWMFEGRGLLVSGAHTAGYNRPGVGYGILGNFDMGDVEAARVILFILTQHLRNLRHNQGFVNLGNLRPENGREVWGHQDSKDTRCPGKVVYGLLDQVQFVEGGRTPLPHQVTSNPAFQPAFDRALEVGMFTRWTAVDDVVTAEKLAEFLERLDLLG